MSRKIIRLNYKELRKAAIDHDIDNDIQLAAKIGVSTSQLWRAKRPVEHEKYNSPGTSFIAGVLNAFDGPFEKFFFLEESVARATQEEG